MTSRFSPLALRHSPLAELTAQIKKIIEQITASSLLLLCMDGMWLTCKYYYESKVVNNFNRLYG